MKKYKAHEKGLMVVAVVIVLLFWVVLPNAMGEDWRITGNYLGDTYDTVILQRYLDTTLLGTLTKTDIARWDTIFTSITQGLNLALFMRIESGDTLPVWWSYNYSEGVTLTDDQIDSIVAGIVAGGGAGTGSDTIKLYAIDTSASPDSLVSYARFSVNNSSGVRLLNDLNTYSNGYKTIYLDPASYSIVTFAPGYYFPAYALTVSGNSDSVAIAGYDTHSPGRSVVYGWVPNPRQDNEWLDGVMVTASRSDCKNSTADSAATTTTLIIPPYNVVDYTDSLGYFALSLINSSEYDKADCGSYNIVGRYGEAVVFELSNVWVTGDFNVGDSLATRN